ncbi:sugar kinase [Actinoplanes sp. CA-030573]|uniref:sugar kinase n=1 Tax=Actinoplanes sp. CA-030573 TaxID=3239898 RepID=UPI003D8B7E52
MTNGYVLTAGEVCGLLLAEPGTPLRRAQRLRRGVAGAESNVAVALARLGHNVVFCGRVGDDAAGDWIRDTLRGEGVDVSHLRTDPERPTGLIVRDCVAGRPLTVNYHRRGSAGSALSAEDLDDDVVRHASAVFVSGITAALTPQTAAFTDRLLNLAGGAAVPVLYDPNVRLRLAPAARWSDDLRRLRDRIDTILVGDSELAQLGIAEPGQLLSDRTHTVVVKRGARGATAITKGGITIDVPARAVPTIDPVGAGDAFDAGFMSAQLHGQPLRDALKAGAAVASLVVSTATDLDGLPTARETEMILHSAGGDVDR